MPIVAITTSACPLLVSVRPTEDDNVIKHSFVIVSESSDHSRIAAHSCVQRVIDEVIKIYPNLRNELTVHLWSDGCASQFRSRFVFKRTTYFPKYYSINHYYDEKGPMDGVSGCVKNFVYRAVMSSRPAEFAVYAQKHIKGVNYLHACQNLK